MNQLQEKFNALFPSWVTVVATVISFTILLIVMTILVWKPVKKMVADRKKHIQTNIDEAQRQNDVASSDRKTANDELVQAKVEAANIVSKSRLIAEKEANLIKIATNKNTIRMLNDAKAEIRSQKELLKVETKQEIVEVALAAAKKIIQKEVDNKTNRKLVEDYIKQV